MVNVLENRFYYLDNFHIVVDWILDRYHDLLTYEESEFIRNFHLLPQTSRALLVRLVMRKGDLFRSGKLAYPEIGAIEIAIAPLVELGWIDCNPLLNLDAMFGLLKKTEIVHIFGSALEKNAVTRAKKTEQLLALSTLTNDILVTQNFSSWYPESDECVYKVRVGAICDHIKLLFFGNLHQDWTEFVLADLGVFRYEKVAFASSSRGFQSRKDVDDYHFLFQCRERFLQGEAPEVVLKVIPTNKYESILSEGRRSKLLFQIGQHYEKNKEFYKALDVYGRGNYPGSRLRIIRTMERTGQFESALVLTEAAQRQPESEAEKQQLQRIFPRLNRSLDRPKIPTIAKVSVPRIDLSLPNLSDQTTVEEQVRDHLEKNSQRQAALISDESHIAHIYYVENGLINSLFGLLCWSAVFAPIPNAFFHPFHTGPADLYSPAFYQRRAVQFGECLRQLDSDEYIFTIRQYFTEKWGIQSPFVFWPLMTEALLDLALSCIPAHHLKRCFERILLDIKSNRAGFPDLIQFWPSQRTYRMIEVKGPGDRLQDNQLRWIDYCASHDIPIAVCYVQWAE